MDFVDFFLVFLSICCKADLVVLNFLNFCLSEKLFISPSILNEILPGNSNLGCRFSPFSTLNISCHSLLACGVSAETSAVKRTGFPLYVTCCFSLTAFNILYLCLVFVSFSMFLGMFLLGFILYGTLCLLDLIDYFLFSTREIFNYNLFKNFLMPFLFLFFWDLYNSDVGAFDIVLEVSESILSSFYSFSFILFFRSFFSTILSSSSLIHSSASDILQLISSRLYFISLIVLFVSVCLFFYSSSSFSQFSHSVVSYSLQPHRLQHTRPTCQSPTPRIYSNSCPLSQ